MTRSATLVMTEIPSADPIRSLSEVLLRQRAAFLRDGPPTLRQRKADLQKLKSVILAHQSEIEQALH